MPESESASVSASTMPSMSLDSQRAAPLSVSQSRVELRAMNARKDEQVHTYLVGALVDAGRDAETEQKAKDNRAQEGAASLDEPPRVADGAKSSDSNSGLQSQSERVEVSEARNQRNGLLTEASPNRTGSQRLHQDRERAIEQIERRIRRTMPMVYWNTSRKDQLVGRAVVRFRLNNGGYVASYELVASSGDLEVDKASRTVLHLAEPYMYVPGWVELSLAFRG